MGGTLAKLKRKGNKIFVAVFSPALQIEENKHILEELHNSMKVFGLYDKDYKIYDYRTRFFPLVSPEIQNDIYNLKKKFKPDLVFCPSENALHPDHSVVGRCVASVFQETSIYHFEDIRGNHKQTITHWEEITEQDLAKKLEALHCYKSQFQRKYFDFNKIKHLASSRGLQVGMNIVEGFEHIRTLNKA